MRTTIYKCDKCGKEDTDNKISLDTVGVYVGYNAQGYGHANPNVVLRKEWCLECRVANGLAPKPSNKPEMVATQMTLDDFVREIVREEVQNLTGAC